jgi:hypothetical protein
MSLAGLSRVTTPITRSAAKTRQRALAILFPIDHFNEVILFLSDPVEGY